MIFILKKGQFKGDIIFCTLSTSYTASFTVDKGGNYVSSHLPHWRHQIVFVAIPGQ